MAYKKEKIKLAKTAYITFGLILICIVVAILLLIPSDKSRMASRFKYTTTDEQKKEVTVNLENDNVYDIISYRKFKRLINKDKKIYVFFGNEKDNATVDAAVTYNTSAKKDEFDIKKIYYLDSKKLDKDELASIKKMLKKVNEDVRTVNDIPTYDLWVFDDGKIQNAASCYSELSDRQDVELHIFR